jgi:hypothetical protein
MRLSALGARFLLFFVLAYYLPPKDVGLYGLISATVSYAALFIGIDFYQYSNRELRQAPFSDQFSIIYTSARIYIVFYIIAIPLFYLIFLFDIISLEYFYITFAILIFEHIGQEAYRILIMIDRNILAGWVLFLRLGFWVFVLTIVMYLNPEFRNIETVLVAWCMGTLSSLSFAIKPILSLKHGSKLRSMGKDWVNRGLKVAMPLLIGTLCLRATVTFDRYLMERVNSREMLGVYVFFSGMAAALPAILEAGVFSFSAPKLISAANNPSNSDYKAILRRMLTETVFVSFIFCASSLALLNIIIERIPNKLYGDNYIIFFMCIIAQTLISISMVFHFAIYARRLDFHIIASHAIGLCVFLISYSISVNFSELFSVPIAIILCNSSVLIYKYLAYKK